MRIIKHVTSPYFEYSVKEYLWGYQIWIIYACTGKNIIMWGTDIPDLCNRVAKLSNFP